MHWYPVPLFCTDRFQPQETGIAELRSMRSLPVQCRTVRFLLLLCFQSTHVIVLGFSMNHVENRSNVSLRSLSSLLMQSISVPGGNGDQLQFWRLAFQYPSPEIRALFLNTIVKDKSSDFVLSLPIFLRLPGIGIGKKC